MTHQNFDLAGFFGVLLRCLMLHRFYLMDDFWDSWAELCVGACGLAPRPQGTVGEVRVKGTRPGGA